MQELIALATHLADEAGIIAREYFRQPFNIQRKADQSPVTIADQSIEARLREILQRERPQDSILGEEFDNIQGTSNLTWVIDPIDGTKSFMMGRPTFGTLIALCEDSKPILGIIDQPISNERWIGAKGHPTTLNGVPIQTRKNVTLDTAVMASTTPEMFDTPIYERFGKHRFAWGSDCYAYGLLACGHVDLILEDDLKPFDFAALSPIIEGAGGFIRDWQGNPLTLASKGQVIALGDPALWNATHAHLTEA